jgi:hypothetical protein
MFVGLLLTYGRAMSVLLNTRKSKAMAAGSWDTSMDMLDFPIIRK